MAKRGRKPIPAALDKLRGHAGKRKRKPVDQAPMPEGEIPPGAVVSFKVPPAPAHLAPIARVEWARLAEKLVNMGLLRELDLVDFELRCAAYAEWRACDALIQKKGRTYRSKGLIKIRPEVRIASDARKAVLAFDNRYGLNPVARADVAHVTGEGNQPELPLEPKAPAATNPVAPTPPSEWTDDQFFAGPPN